MANIMVRQPSTTSPSPARPAGLDPFQLFQQMMQWDPFGSDRQASMFSPDFEVRETPDHYQFRADMPGVAEKDIEVTLTGNQLTISARRDAEEQRDGETYYLYERRYGSVSRSFQLPQSAHLDEVQAELAQGVLTVTVGKRPEVKPRKITIRGVVDKLKRLGSGEKPEA